MNDYIIIGTEVKYLMTATGFDMNADDFNVCVYCGGVSKTFAKSDLVFDADAGNWYLCFDTTDFRSGTMVATVTAFVPDTDFPDGVRTEMAKYVLGPLKSA